MDAATARARAAEALQDLEREQPLTLVSPDSPAEYEWCWLYTFNTVRAIETGDFADSLVTGPLVVPKSGAEPWVAPSSPPVERWLNEYATQHDLHPVPIPVQPDPFA